MVFTFLKYSVAPAYENFVEHSIIRVDKLQEKFDQAFMTLDMMECDRAIKEQSFVTLSTIYLFIQGAIAAANNCATIEANNLYKQANTALDHFIRKIVGCSGTNRLINFNNMATCAKCTGASVRMFMSISNGVCTHCRQITAINKKTMLYPKLTNCKECEEIPSLLKK
jgi:hypothetical protein